MKSQNWNWEFFVNDTRPIGGDYTSKEGRRFGVSVAPPEPEDRGEDNSLPLSALIGFEPQESLQLDTFNNDPTNHVIMGQLLLHFAISFGGMVDFGGALTPRTVPHNVWQKEWADVEGYFNAMAAGMPGRIVSVEYETANGRTWAYHIADAVFLEAWLRHPDFHMIK